MYGKMKQFIESNFLQEVILLVFSFVLFTLNDWILIASWKSLFLGIIYFILLYGHAQINRFFLLPILIEKHKLLQYLLFTFLLLVISAVALNYLTINQLYKSCFLHNNPIKMSYQYQMGILLGSLICILGTTRLVEYYRAQKIQASKELLFNKNQMAFLNMQLNPHFLFNTLNTIYGISFKYPEKTPELILKVSELLRYQVENTKKETVTIEKEVDFISSYIELEKERMGHRCKIDFVCNIEHPKDFKIAPMLLFTYVENAFKHGTCSIDDCFVKIDLSILDGYLLLNIANSVPTKKSETSTKVGLENTRMRLEMLYKNNYDLQIKNDKNIFTVALKIKL